MKQRRKLEKGEKIHFHGFRDETTLYEGFVSHQEGAEVYLQESSAFEVNDRLDRYSAENRFRADSIHRLQVVKTFKKVKKKPLIVWTDARGLLLAKRVSESILFTSEKTGFTCVPFRPLTKREREKWGV